ncbi:hypothetical protein COCMIDRAFT_95682 [Bipolaris oryzae ATCC 44560]|uniref:Uncharacterized protein n=1 Tax=Bipolaris oryzae ATCC 44560 TaxID=930090 RepID=W6Z0U7_COCMI|nr:uncharacterized protein COCMIDRAFT_95682 [Bipolaris oryzae ATCC 44560]EUC45377.1 hypothetical protein COCMIDRAFT_95682 [Bipolaris oryzae ATCC 44560]
MLWERKGSVTTKQCKGDAGVGFVVCYIQTEDYGVETKSGQMDSHGVSRRMIDTGCVASVRRICHVIQALSL